RAAGSTSALGLHGQRIGLPVEVDSYGVAVVDLATEQLSCQLVSDRLLHQSPQRPRAVHRVEPGQRQPLACCSRDLEGDTPPRKTSAERIDLQVDDVAQLVRTERVERDDLVESVQELRLERAAYDLHHR